MPCQHAAYSVWQHDLVTAFVQVAIRTPNRGQRGDTANPLPAEIIAARKAAGLTQTDAAGLVCGSLRAWQQWEAGDRRMHPGLWMLFGLRTEEAASGSETENEENT